MFPDGSTLAAGASAVITCESSGWNGDYQWQETKVWHASKKDAGTLMDAYGRVIDTAD